MPPAAVQSALLTKQSPSPPQSSGHELHPDDHRAACATSGALASHVTRLSARPQRAPCRHEPLHPRARCTPDRHRLQWLWHGAQLAVDTNCISSGTRSGEPGRGLRVNPSSPLGRKRRDPCTPATTATSPYSLSWPLRFRAATFLRLLPRRQPHVRTLPFGRLCVRPMCVPLEWHHRRRGAEGRGQLFARLRMRSCKTNAGSTPLPAADSQRGPVGPRHSTTVPPLVGFACVRAFGCCSACRGSHSAISRYRRARGMPGPAQAHSPALNEVLDLAALSRPQKTPGPTCACKSRTLRLIAQSVRKEAHSMATCLGTEICAPVAATVHTGIGASCGLDMCRLMFAMQASVGHVVYRLDLCWRDFGPSSISRARRLGCQVPGKRARP